jgi:hypothetical protein
MARQRRIQATKRKHEANKHQQYLLSVIQKYADYIAHAEPQTGVISDDGTAHFYFPSRAWFRLLTPDSSPSGIVFLDGSFLTVKEIFRYDYESEDDTEPRIVPLEFSYHYQIPHRGFFFRYDHHPDIGNSATHPRYHLHVGCWHEGDDKLPSLPRFQVPRITLEAVLNLIVRDFLNPQETD